MNYIDVFNGDADGICSLLQLRLANPQQSQLVTGVKRDINLLKRVDIDVDAEAALTVLDISFDKNSDDVKRLLEAGAVIDYLDHHKADTLFSHPHLTTDINLAADTCTALLVNKRLQGKYLAWALTAAFGDNLTKVAQSIAQSSNFDADEIAQMQRLGVLINYNGYGASLDDLYFHPADLYQKLSVFETPFEFLQQDAETFNTLEQGYIQDMDAAQHAPIVHSNDKVKVVELPNEKWSRRVSGVFGNELANQSPDVAHAVIQKNAADTYLVSIRAPLSNKTGADVVASAFPTGGGRKGAAGVNALPETMLDDFIAAFSKQYQ